MSKKTQERNKNLLLYIREGLAEKEDFYFSCEGYKFLLEKTENIIFAEQQKLFQDISDEYKKKLIQNAYRVNKKIKKWEQDINIKIEENKNKYLPIYIFKWFGIENFYSNPNFYDETFSYKDYNISGIDVSSSIIEYINQVKKIIINTNKAREKMVELNKALIHSQATKVAGNKYEIKDDLVSVAYYQFIQCMDETFDFNKGTEFSTYVSACMYYKCKEAKIKYNEMIKIPTARMKDKVKSAKGELDLNAEDIKDNQQRIKESRIRATISNSNMYWSLDGENIDDENSNSKNIDDYILNDGDAISQKTDDIIIIETVDKIINKILKDNRTKKNSVLTRIKALEYSGALDFNNDIGEKTLKEVAKLLYINNYTKTLVTSERARQLIIGGKELLKKEIIKDTEFMMSIGMQKEVNS